MAVHDPETPVATTEDARLDPSRVLFVGMGQSAVGWYRCYMPAMHLGADWIGVVNDPPNLRTLTGLVKRNTPSFNEQPTWSDYDVVVLQQPRGTAWLKLIRGLQSQGIKVVYEVDDYLHAIRKMEDHDYAEYFDVAALHSLELNMRVADAMIVSTDFINRRYRRFNKTVYTCRNGVDMGRYRLTRPPRPTVNIGWAGATGHQKAMTPWLNAVGNVMATHPATCFVSIGQDFAAAFREPFPNRSVSIPFTLIDQYPAAMTMFDVALAPAGKGNFFKGKSDLRWIEAGALGIPIIADPVVYPDIEHGVNGFHASSPEEMQDLLTTLVGDKDLRDRVGAAAKEYVATTRDMRFAVNAWSAALEELVRS